MATPNFEFVYPSQIGMRVGKSAEEFAYLVSQFAMAVDKADRWVGVHKSNIKAHTVGYMSRGRFVPPDAAKVAASEALLKDALATQAQARAILAVYREVETAAFNGAQMSEQATKLVADLASGVVAFRRSEMREAEAHIDVYKSSHGVGSLGDKD